MTVLIAYATTDGQTRKIARFAGDVLSGLGHSVELLNVADASGLDLIRFAGVVLAGSLHVGRFQKALADFIRQNAAALNARPSLFLAVSLAAAGQDAEDWAGLNAAVAQFLAETAWQPSRVDHVAGALRFTEYDFFRAWMMRRIARSKGDDVDPHADKEYTDWAALSESLTQWQAGLAR